MESKFDRLQQDITEIKVAIGQMATQGDVNEIKVILERNTVSLEHHIKRTDILERIVAPLKVRAARWDGVAKFIGYVSVVLGIIATVVSIYKAVA